MIAISKEKTDNVTPTWHDGFLTMLPVIRRHARIAFRELDDDAKEEAIQEVVCNAMKAYVRLVELGKTNIAYASALARYGVAQVRSGRKVGGKLNVRDVSSEYAQRRKGFGVARLDRYDEEEQGWQEIVVEDRHAGPAEVVATKIDFGDWLKMLTSKQRKIANMLAVGETTNAVATKVGVTDGRVSQIRRELMEAWEAFVADTVRAV
jgi:hypothetical protein